MFTQIESANAVDYYFSMTTTNQSSSYWYVYFIISAKGTFYVDCGTNGTLSRYSGGSATVSGNTITKGNVDVTTFKCQYTSSGSKTIQIGGRATEYNTAGTTFSVYPVNITYYNEYLFTKLASLSGNLSTIFPYLGSGSGQRPRFFKTFYQCANLLSIPDTLFSGYTTGAESLFNYTFAYSGLTSIPENLFRNITTSAPYLFRGTLEGCTGLTSIPENLFNFGGNNVAGQEGMWQEIFAGCTGLTSIPANLFQRVTSGAKSLFYFAFNGCTGLTSIPENLFRNITTSAEYMFLQAFEGCTGLTSIPENLFNFGGNNVSGQQNMFQSTFAGCTGLTSIPANLFQRVTTGAGGVFGMTFSGCTNIRGYIPPSTFAGLIANSSPTANYMWQYTFKNTQLVTECPTGTHQYFTGYEGEDTSTYTKWNGYVSCEPGIKLTWDGSSGTPAVCTLGGTFVPPTPAARPGYRFTGWKVKTISQ